MPKLRNETPFAAELVPMIDPVGRAIGVAIVKGTFIVSPDGELGVAAAQVPIAFVDEPWGDPTGKEVRVPSDLVDYKPAVDVLVIRPAGSLADSPLAGREIACSVGNMRVKATIAEPWPFGPVRRDHPARLRFAGTYDQEWVKNRMPLLPEDFDPRYNQAAPPAQTLPRLAGDEPVAIANLYGPDSILRCHLPGKAVVIAGNVLGHYFTEVARLDTLEIWAEGPLLTLVWRHAIRTRQKIEEIGRVHAYWVRLRTVRELYGVA